MNVLIINTSEKTGGAAVASNRLMNALNNNGVKARMLVRDKETDEITVSPIGHHWRSQWAFLWERLCIFFHLRFKRKHLFEIDIANAGLDVTKTRYFKEADIIHLEWINQGYLSLKGIRKILDSGKPVVWTMHDMWAATGICHITMDCQRYTSACGHCPYLPGDSSEDLSSKVFKRKKRILDNHSITFVACSKWLAGQAASSSLFHRQKVLSIPNPIDTHLFRKESKVDARNKLGLPPHKKYILFAAQRATNVNKGMNYLVEACAKVVADHPDFKEKVGIVILGGHADEFEQSFGMHVYPLGYVSDSHKIVDVYNACDVFCLPSLSENLPNTIMEAMACGVPCIGFKVGGIPEEIDHLKNGYVAKYRDSGDLAHGIHWILDEADYELLSRNAVDKVAANYSQRSVAMKYIDVYTDALAQKGYHI